MEQGRNQNSIMNRSTELIEIPALSIAGKIKRMWVPYRTIAVFESIVLALK